MYANWRLRSESNNRATDYVHVELRVYIYTSTSHTGKIVYFQNDFNPKLNITKNIEQDLHLKKTIW